jgi:hypothetical protein
MFVLLLFGEFMSIYPTLRGCRRSHSTYKVESWTALTSDSLSAVLKTGENGDG